jgi:hypothetical protein
MKISSRVKAFVVVMLSLLMNQAAFGWGQTGHRVVGQIAEEHLNRKALKAIREILGHESLAMSSTWADEIKSDSQYDYAKPWHYVNIPEGLTYHECEKAESDIIEAIGRMKKQLTNPESTLEEKQFALRFLVHLVGDLHQPMHAGYKKDLGGNRVPMKWFGDDTNLHSVWDSKMIDFKGLSYTELAASINHADKKQIKNWQNSDVEDWLQEAMEMRTEVYASAEKDLYAYRYAYIYFPTVENQLLKAGVRLAGVLNELLG